MFNQSGLFAYSRHPNFIGEQTIWVAVYLFGVGVTGQLLNLGVWGICGLITLF